MNPQTNPSGGEILNMIADPHTSPGRNENDDLFVTENGDFICFATTLHNWNASGVRRQPWLRTKY